MAFTVASFKLQKHWTQCTILYLVMAQGCNLNCTYCPIPELEQIRGASLLTTENAIAGFELWRQHASVQNGTDIDLYLIFYGGEPLLNKEGIKAVLDYVVTLRHQGDEFAQRVKFLLATNGALLDSEVVDWCLRFGMSVTVGIDGFNDETNASRLSPEFDSTTGSLRAIKRLVDAGIPTFASVTVTPNNLLEIGAYQIMLKNLGVEKFGFNFMKGKALLEVMSADMIPGFYRQAARAVIAVTNDGSSDVAEYQVEKKCTAFATGEFFPHDCTCYGSQLVILANGNISNCPFSKHDFGYISDVSIGFRIWDEPLVRRWQQRSPLVNQAYSDLDFKALCGAGCAWSCLELKGDDMASDDASTIFTEEIFDHLIWKGVTFE
jgi:radical SAM protein with 4Fe4S-binding SPASM domain